ncbi:MAG: UvrD-helicase domain-containing protein [Muribaculaceae bacterium]|nr:UvrD-helicase domain-containing protein [Muribaculaceae bacterium]
MSEANYNYLDLLNDQQREAVVYKDGPALVIAGAGSGKTRVLTYKIVDLLRSGYEPWRILALTFTNKAAREMKERIKDVVGERVASKLRMGTFHSVFLFILRQHAEEIGFKPSFTIYDSSDSRSLLKSIIKEMQLDEKIYKPATIHSIISNAKNALIDPDQYLQDADNLSADRKAKRPMTGKIFKAYCERCKRADAMDFDDILVYMNILLRDFPDIKRHYQEFFRYILVDEYQDTNFAQHLIISQLSALHKHLCVVGDDAQSIYSFRGANIGNILNMERRYPDLKIFKLERNYRSTQNIINAAGSLIDKNTRQMKKNVYSENDVGERVKILSTYSDIEEAYLVANMIAKSRLSLHDSYEDYAVLYRTNAQSRALEESLRKRNIAYRIYGGLSFYQRKEIKDAVCYFRLAINPDDDEALRRIINYPARGIGDTTMRKLSEAATASNLSIWQVLQDPISKGVAVNGGTLKKLTAFRDMVQEFLDENAKGANAYALGQLIFNRSGILTVLNHDNTPESISKQENLKELLAGLKDFVDTRQEEGNERIGMQEFLSDVMLATDQDSSDETSDEKVTLMTCHAAKGLEFKHIFVVGVEEELLPSAMSMNSTDEVEEERRLLYVAMTRAKETCVLTYAKTRFRNGQTVQTRPSRFLSEIGKKFIQVETSSDFADTSSSASFVNPMDLYNSYRMGGKKSFASTYDSPRTISHGKRERTVSGSSGFFDRSSIRSSSGSQKEGTPGTHGPEEVPVGTVIIHPKLGEGVVTKLDYVMGEGVITVNFTQAGDKKLYLRFAQFNLK